MPQIDRPVGPGEEDRALPEDDPRTLRSYWSDDEETVARDIEYCASRHKVLLDALH
jgi:hypothetical protein